jgi:DNA end-binding protein Ku
MATMLFGDEVLAPDRLDELDAVSEAEASDRELKMAEQLIESLASEFDPTKFKDEYRERVINLIERKAAGEEIAVQPQAEEPAAAPDLMAALEASLAAMEDEPERKAPAKPRKRSPSGSGTGSGSGAKSATSTKSAKSGETRATRSRAKAKS